MVGASLFRVLGKAARLSALDWLDLLVAARQLAAARWALSLLSSHDLVAYRRDENILSTPSLRERERLLAGRASKAINTMAAHVPWRSDCLVQALAARRWLASAGICSNINIGVRRSATFEAHAWLCVGDIIVTGGDISPFVLMPLDNAAAQLVDRERAVRWPK